MSNATSAPRPAKAPNAAKDKVVVRGLNFYLRPVEGAEGRHPVPS